MSKNLKKQWRVQTKNGKGGNWINRGLFETRKAARAKCTELRGCYSTGAGAVWFDWKGYGFGNTRYLPYVKGAKA